MVNWMGIRKGLLALITLGGNINLLLAEAK